MTARKQFILSCSANPEAAEARTDLVFEAAARMPRR